MSAEIETSPVRFSHRGANGALSSFVEVLWYWSGYEVQQARERLLPMGTTEMVISLNHPSPSSSGLAGPRSEALIIDRSNSDELLGVHFKPRGVFPFLPFPAGQLHNAWITLDDVWGKRDAGHLLEQLHVMRTPERKIDVLEEWLMCRLNGTRGHTAVAYALGQFLRDPGLLSSAAAAQEVNLSQRRFIELFENEVGLTPKRFCRVQRFQNVIQAIQFQDDVDWAGVAAFHGYTDQSHFIHDFKSFSGLRPSEYLGLRTSHLSHVRVPG